MTPGTVAGRPKGLQGPPGPPAPTAKCLELWWGLEGSNLRLPPGEDGEPARLDEISHSLRGLRRVKQGYAGPRGLQGPPCFVSNFSPRIEAPDHARVPPCGHVARAGANPGGATCPHGDRKRP